MSKVTRVVFVTFQQEESADCDLRGPESGRGFWGEAASHFPPTRGLGKCCKLPPAGSWPILNLVHFGLGLENRTKTVSNGDFCTSFSTHRKQGSQGSVNPLNTLGSIIGVATS